ncbi:MAG: hypothetical protein V1731_03185 [Candidatus Aenigmatarchaeota archaeon]
MPEHKKSISMKLPKFDLWMASTLFLLIVLIVFNFNGMSLNSKDLATKAIDYINGNIVQGGGVSFVSVKDSGAFYEVTTLYQGQEIPIYVTKDGAYVFLSQPASLKPQSTTTTLPQAITKTDKPAVDLYVWANCPYGKQGEAVMKPAYDLLKNNADFNLIFIGPVTDSKDVAAQSCFDGQGKTTDDAVKTCCNSYVINGKTIYSCGLHGKTEALESERQACVLKEYGKDGLWEYIAEFASSSDVDKSINAAGADVNKINVCMSDYGWYDTLQGNSNTADQNNVHGSESILLNGFKLNPAGYRWSPENLKSLICQGFNTAPSECSQTLSGGSGDTPTSASCG